MSCNIILNRFLKIVFKIRTLNILHIWRKDFNCFFFAIPNLYAGMRSARAMRKYEKWDSYSGAMGFARTIRRRRCSRLCPRKRDTRHSPGSLVAENVIGLYRAMVFITIRARKARESRTLEKHDLIYYELHSRRRAMSCAFALSAFWTQTMSRQVYETLRNA